MKQRIQLPRGILFIYIFVLGRHAGSDTIGPQKPHDKPYKPITPPRLSLCCLAYRCAVFVSTHNDLMYNLSKFLHVMMS